MCSYTCIYNGAVCKDLNLDIIIIIIPYRLVS